MNFTSLSLRRVFGWLSLLGVMTYTLSCAFSSNRSLFTESLRVFVEETNIQLSTVSSSDSLNIMGTFDIEKEWLAEFNMKNVKIMQLEQAVRDFPCDEPGIAFQSVLNLGFLKFLRISNQPCEDAITVNAVLIWTGFGWKAIHTSQGGMA